MSSEVAQFRAPSRSALDEVFDQVLPCERCDEIPPCPCSCGSRAAANQAWRRRLAVPPPVRGWGAVA